MKIFAINETEWVAAETQEEALDFEGYDPDDLEVGVSVEEIPESEWDEEVGYLTEDSEDENDMEYSTVRKMLALHTSFPCKIMTEMD